MYYPHFAGGFELPRRKRTQRDRGRAIRVVWSNKKRWKTVLASAILMLLSIAALVAVAFVVLIAKLKPTLPSVAAIAAFRPVEATTIWSSDGILLAKLQIENRKVVPLEQISPNLINATLAVEDNRFYEHQGLDVKGIARAAWGNLVGGDMTGQGGSTITQQLARNVSQFRISKEKSLTRKVREAMTAVRIEQVYDKHTILELYLNQIYYGSGAYGVEAAARTYFGKSAKDLTLAEASLIAGLPQRPVTYSPYISLDAARNRRDVVLKRLLNTGRITPAQYEQAKEEPIRLAPRRANNTVYRAPYFVDWIVQDLIARHGVDAVYSGWKVVTTLDWRMQEAAEHTLPSGLSYGATQGALVCIDPHTGQVRAMVGGVDYKKDRFNAVTQGKRQPGSAFKPIVYAAAFDTGAVALDTPIKDAKLVLPEGGHKTWVVHNYGGGYSNEERTVKDGIVHSINTVAVQTAQDTGLDQVIAYARRLGITTDLAPYLSLALGASAVRPIELCSAYGVFASEGERYQPIGIESVTDSRGRVVERDEEWRRRTVGLLQAQTLMQINEALHEVVQHGTGTAASGVPMAFGKTGTTSDNRDAWFVGYTPDLVTAVWVADPHRDSKGILRYRVMPGATGGHVAAPIWARFMAKAVPIQQKVNRRRGVKPWTIELPPPPAPEVDKTAQTEPGSNNVPTYAWNGYAGQTASSASNSARQSAGWSMPPDAQVVYPWPQQSQTTTASYSGSGNPGGDGRATVTICVDSGRLATEWCPTTATIRVRAGHAPTGYCRTHHAPPGE